MDGAIDAHGIPNYFDMFSKFGQTGDPTFSSVKISTDAISIKTYTVNDNGEASLFDEIKITRQGLKTNIADTPVAGRIKFISEGNKTIRIESPEEIVDVRIYSFAGTQMFSQRSNIRRLAYLPVGVYLMNVKTTSGVYTERFVLKN
jgi:hypothetical protein